MSFVLFNSNPDGNYVGDCVIRAISKVTGRDWDDTYIAVAVTGFALKDMPSSNNVWGTYLRWKGFKRYAIPNTCPDCYSVGEFCKDNPRGTYLLATGSHVVAVVDGDYYDIWDSGDEVPIYYWLKEGDGNGV